MKITVDAKTFAEAAARAAKVAPKRSPLPALENVELAATEAGTVRLTVGDIYEYTMVTVADRAETVGEPGTVRVNAQQLAELAKTAAKNGGNVTAHTTTTEELYAPVTHLAIEGPGGGPVGTVRVHDEELTLTGPTEAAWREQVAASMPAATFADALRRVALAASTDKMRDMLNAVAIQRDGAGTLLVATDSYRLAVARLPLALPEAWGDGATVPLDIVKKLVATMAKDGTATIGREPTGEVTVGDSRTEWRIRTLEEAHTATPRSFPKWRPLIPDPRDVTATIVANRRELAEALAPIVAAAKRIPKAKRPTRAQYPPVTVEAGAGRVRLNWQHEDVRLTATVPAGVDANEYAPTEQAYDPTYLADALRTIGDTEQVAIQWTANGKPALVQADGEGDTRYLVMPVLIAQ